MIVVKNITMAIIIFQVKQLVSLYMGFLMIDSNHAALESKRGLSG